MTDPMYMFHIGQVLWLL